MEIGYKLSSEEHGPNELVRFARMAEVYGFAFAMISDRAHLHQIGPDQAGFMEFYQSEKAA